MIIHDKNDSQSQYKEKKARQRSLLIRVIGFLILLVPVLLLFITNPVILLICLFCAGIVAFIAAYRLSQ